MTLSDSSQGLCKARVQRLLPDPESAYPWIRQIMAGSGLSREPCPRCVRLPLSCCTLVSLSYPGLADPSRGSMQNSSLLHYFFSYLADLDVVMRKLISE
jgi:hypothetical protein